MLMLHGDDLLQCDYFTIMMMMLQKCYKYFLRFDKGVEACG